MVYLLKSYSVETETGLSVSEPGQLEALVSQSFQGTPVTRAFVYISFLQCQNEYPFLASVHYAW